MQVTPLKPLVSFLLASAVEDPRDHVPREHELKIRDRGESPDQLPQGQLLRVLANYGANTVPPFPRVSDSLSTEEKSIFSTAAIAASRLLV